MEVIQYVCRETVERVHHHHIDGFMLDYDNISCVNRWYGQIQLHDEGEDICRASGSSERLCRYHVLEWFMTDHKRYLAYEMSKGLPFLRQVQQQIGRDGDQIVHANHVELRYCSVYGFRLVVDHVRENHTWYQIWPILTEERPFEDSPGCHLLTTAWSLRPRGTMIYRLYAADVVGRTCHDFWDRPTPITTPMVPPRLPARKSNTTRTSSR